MLLNINFIVTIVHVVICATHPIGASNQT